MLGKLKNNWPEYLIEGWALGMFMVSAGFATILLEHPGSPLRAAIGSADLRRVIVGLCMGMTAIALNHLMHSSHETMPLIMLAPDEQWHLVAYIISLRGRPARRKR